MAEIRIEAKPNQANYVTSLLEEKGYEVEFLEDNRHTVLCIGDLTEEEYAELYELIEEEGYNIINK